MNGAYFSDAWACAVTGLHRTTVTRMRRDGRLRPELLRLAALELDGMLSLIHSAWEGWKLDRASGELVAPGGWSFSPGELLAVPLRYQQLRALEADVQRLRASTSDLEAARIERELRGLARQLLEAAQHVGRIRGLNSEQRSAGGLEG